MQRVKVGPSSAAASSQEAQTEADEMKVRARMTVIASFAAFGAIIFALRVGKNRNFILVSFPDLCIPQCWMYSVVLAHIGDAVHPKVGRSVNESQTSTNLVHVQISMCVSIAALYFHLFMQVRPFLDLLEIN